MSRSSFSKSLSRAGDLVAFRRPLPVHLQVDLMLLLQHRAELVLVELLGVLEVHPHHVGERLVAVGHHVPEVAQRDHIPQPQGVPPIDQQLEHDLEGGALPLQRTRYRHQGLDQCRAEGVHQLEHRPVGFPGQQDLHDLLPHLGRLLEGFLQFRPAGIVLGAQDPLLGDDREVAVLQGDGVEPPLPVREHVGEVELLDPGHVLADQVPQVTLAGHEADDGDRAIRLPGFDQLRQLVPLGLDETHVRRVRGQPEDQLVEEQDQGVVAERLGMGADDAEAHIEIDVGFILARIALTVVVELGSL